MKRVLMVAALVLALLSATLAPAAAVPADQLLGLSQYFPEDTIAYIALRTDDAVIDEWTALLEHLAEKLPPGALQDTDLRQMLDESLQMFGDEATFENTIRTWLGDTVAFGFVGTDALMGGRRASQPPFLVAASITDRAAAQAFLEQTFEMSETDFTSETRGSFTLIVPEIPSNAFYALGDDLLLVGTTEDVLPLNMDFVSFGDNAEVQGVVNRLPAADYSVLAALNLRDVMTELYGQLTEMGSDEPGMEIIQGLGPVYENYPAQAIGFTILDDRSLTLDFAQQPFDISLLADTFLGDIPMMTDMPAVDLTFAQHVPADAPFFVQGTSLGSMVDAAITGLGVGMELGAQFQSANSYSSNDLPPFLEGFTAGDLRAFADLTVAGMTGLNLSEEILPVLNGNFALFARLFPTPDMNVTLDAGLAFEVTDAAGTQAIYDGLLNALTRYEANFSEENGVITLPGFISDLMEAGSSRRPRPDAPVIDFGIGLNGDVLAVGTSDAVDASLNPGAATMADDPAFQAAQQYFLPGTQSMVYIGFQPFRDLMDGMMAEMSGNNMQMMMSRMALDVVDSISVSGTASLETGSLARVVITLAE